MKEVMIIRHISVILAVVSLFFISACSEESNIQYYSSKDETLEQYINNNDIQGNIDLITTMENESILVIQSRESSYYIGELVENKEGYYIKRISDNVDMTVGGSWELRTEAKNKYTIFFEKGKEDVNYTKLSNGEYGVSLVEGHTISSDDLASTSVIKEIETVNN